MRNLFKIAFLLIICSNSVLAANGIKGVVLNKKNDLHPNIALDSVKRTITDPKNTDPKKRNILNTKNETDIIISDESESYVAEQLINVASDNLGIVYHAGGTTKNGFDCSGLIYSTFKKFDITLPRSSNEMADIGTKIDLQNAKKGDLIFFINRGQHRINHVGMVVEVNGDDVKFIHSSTQSGVVISSMNEPYYKRTFVQLSRIIE
jgi:cell wall-associated NlpC family hydrolase